MKLRITAILILAVSLSLLSACRRPAADAGTVTIALSEKFSGLDTLSNSKADAAADRIRTLIYNTLVKKNDKFEYVGELAKEISVGDDRLTVTFRLHDNVVFHNQQRLTSADVKYTLDSLFSSTTSVKAGSFFDSEPDPSDAEGKKRRRIPHITSVEVPDAGTIVLKVARPALVNQTLSNLVTIPIIPTGTFDTQKTSPVGSGPFKFETFDEVNSQVRLSANDGYWEGAPKIRALIVRTVPDGNALQAELQSGGVDVAPLPTNLPPHTIRRLGEIPNLRVDVLPGSNVQYMGFNLEAPTVRDVRIRQAVAMAIDKAAVIEYQLAGQAKPADSIIPTESWAFAKGVQYSYDPDGARKLLQEAGYQGQAIKFKVSAGNAAVRELAQVIQDSLSKVGLNVEIEPIDSNTLLAQYEQGQFELTTGRWVGGNQDPIFLQDLFSSAYFPTKRDGGKNRARYSNPEFDKVIASAINAADKETARGYYAEAQEIVSKDLPLIPLWYTSNVVVSNKRIGNVTINASGDWSFVRNLTVNP